MNEQIIDNESTKVLVLTAYQIEKIELDHEDDLKDEICSRLSIRKCKLLYTGWDYTNSNYVVVIQV